MDKLAALMQALGGRRFILSLGCGIMTTVLQWYGKLDASGSTYALVVLGTVGAFITGNTVEIVKTNRADKEQL